MCRRVVNKNEKGYVDSTLCRPALAYLWKGMEALCGVRSAGPKQIHAQSGLNHVSSVKEKASKFKPCLQ